LAKEATAVYSNGNPEKPQKAGQRRCKKPNLLQDGCPADSHHLLCSVGLLAQCVAVIPGTQPNEKISILQASCNSLAKLV
jgi:hypothetical protein